jgi:hypothetical protein
MDAACSRLAGGSSAGRDRAGLETWPALLVLEPDGLFIRIDTMNAFAPSRRKGAGPWPAWVLGALLAAPAGSLGAGTAALSPAPACQPLVAMEWWDKVYHAFETSVNSRQGMLQFGAVGMLVALYIIWYRR